MTKTKERPVLPQVFFRSALFPMPGPERDPLHERADELRKVISNARKDPQFEAFLRSLKLATSAFNDDEAFGLLKLRFVRTQRLKSRQECSGTKLPSRGASASNGKLKTFSC